MFDQNFEHVHWCSWHRRPSRRTFSIGWPHVHRQHACLHLLEQGQAADFCMLVDLAAERGRHSRCRRHRHLLVLVRTLRGLQLHRKPRQYDAADYRFNLYIRPFLPLYSHRVFSLHSLVLQVEGGSHRRTGDFPPELFRTFHRELAHSGGQPLRVDARVFLCGGVLLVFLEHFHRRDLRTICVRQNTGPAAISASALQSVSRLLVAVQNLGDLCALVGTALVVVRAHCVCLRCDAGCADRRHGAREVFRM
mmetsp:Transcript_112739/g.318646  ORF Transcript_112739/g.318646 Transcript_112739/m.318646 type:complete len:250 (-) Transcript_112739:388-1137(-)